MDVAGVALAGLAAGMASGLLGIGGGVLFVPCLVILFGESQLEAEATSLLAILPTVAAGTWRQHRYGNLRVRSAATLGLASLGGVGVGVLIATSLPEDLLRRLFGVLMLGGAAQLAWRARPSRAYPSDT
jgi:uncharacterized membrane protein YfcA